jgi:hypothetical protein
MEGVGDDKIYIRTTPNSKAGAIHRTLMVLIMSTSVVSKHFVPAAPGSGTSANLNELFGLNSSRETFGHGHQILRRSQRTAHH